MSLGPLACDGCLGSGQCWVCLGTGAFDMLHRTGNCNRCAGSGRCTICRPKPIVIRMPDQRATPARAESLVASDL